MAVGDGLRSALDQSSRTPGFFARSVHAALRMSRTEELSDAPGLTEDLVVGLRTPAARAATVASAPSAAEPSVAHAVVAVVGLGYVGLPTAIAHGQRGG